MVSLREKIYHLFCFYTFQNSKRLPLNSKRLPLEFIDNLFLTFFHQPFGSTCGTTDAHGIDALEPCHVYFVSTLYLIAVVIHALAFLEEYLTVATLSAAHEEHHIMPAGKDGDIRHAVSHLSADGVKALEGSTFHDMRLAVFDDAMELFQALGGLRIEIDVLGEIQPSYLPQMFHILQLLYHERVTLGLSYQTQNFGMSLLSEDDNLRLWIVDILLLDASLQLQYHRAGGINNFNVVALGKGIGLRWFSMGTKQYLHAMQLLHLLVVDGDESCFMQSFHLHTVMHDISQAVEFTAFLQLFFSFLDGSGHTKAETTAVIYFYLHFF